MSLSSDLREFVGLLNSRGVDYVIGSRRAIGAWLQLFRGIPVWELPPNSAAADTSSRLGRF
jgi:hypothetical protein